MLKLIFLLFLNLVILERLKANENFEKFSCEWDNKLDVPCIEIKKETPNSSEFSNAAINKIVLTKQQIEDIGATDLIDILKIIPDINITQSGPKGQQTSVFMRGSGSNHTVVLINGIAINDQSTTQGLHDFGVDFIQTIQQIEIYPGSSGTHFGTNAIGGAINIILTGDYKNSISASTDNDSNYDFYANKTFIYDKSSLNLKIGTVRNETVSARGSKDDEKDKLENYTANINYEKFINNNSRYYNTIYLRQTIAEYDNSNTKQTNYEGDNRMATIQLGFENNNQLTKKNAVLYYNLYDREYDERGTIDTYESNVVGLKYDIANTLNNNISVGVGVDYKYDWGYFDNNGSYSASTKGNSDNLAIYGNLGWNILGNSNISVFGRIDDHKQTGSHNTYKVNFQQNYKKFKIGGSYMNGLRNPTLYEMFGTDNFGYSGNRNLKPEKSDTYEVFTDIFINKNLGLAIRAFRSNIKNNIEYISNKYQNDSDNVDLNQSGVNSQISFNSKDTKYSIFSSLLSSKKENGSDQLRRPEKNYGANITKKFKSNFLGETKLSIIYNHYAKHFDTHSTSFGTIEMDSSDLIDLKISKEINKNQYFFKVTNLLDENYQRPHGYNQEGRIFKFGLKY